MKTSNLASFFKQPSNIWVLAFGYFAFYTPYGAMTKALSKGLFAGSTGTISGFELLPTVIIGTIAMFLNVEYFCLFQLTFANYCYFLAFYLMKHIASPIQILMEYKLTMNLTKLCASCYHYFISV